MICGIGCDIVEVKRFEQKSLDSKYIERFFSGEEIQQAPENQLSVPLYYASRFAAKEAFVKALGLGMRLGSWQDMEVVHTNLGAPVLKVKDTFKEELEKRFGKAPSLYLSISHSQAYAVAQIIIEK